SKVVPEIINGRTMLPLRFVAESLGADVQWDGTTKTITITYQGG
ncbi:MAG: copper amine oxidase N-terminal domain-containing protein, partial [Thermoprotei archaeon]